MKKLTSLLLVLAMMLSLCATMAVAEEEKPFKGQHFVIWDDYRRYVINSDTNEPSNPKDTSILIYAAYEEWAKENECTYEIKWGSHDALRGAIDAGDVPLLWNANSNWPKEPIAGLCQPYSDELVAALTETYGSDITDALKFKGEVYGSLYPWVGSLAVVWNDTKADELGITTPDEYIAEGNWTYETYFQFLRDCTVDIDGDGKLDTTGFTVAGMSGYSNPHVIFNEEGRLESTLETERMRAWFDYVYTAYTVDGALIKQNVKLNTSSTGAYVMTSLQSNWEPWIPGYDVEYRNGEVIKYCQAPVWKEGDTEQSFGRHVLYMMIPNGCKNVAAAESLIQYTYDRVMAEVEIMADGELSGKHTRMTGSTELSKKVLDAHTAKLAELTADRDEIDAYDPDLRQASIEWYRSQTKLHTLINAPGVDRFITTDAAHEPMYTLPSATSIAQFGPVLQNQCDAFNALYIDGLAD